MNTTPEMPKLPDDEKFVTDFMGTINADDLASLVFPLSRFQSFDDELPTVVPGYLGQISMVVWNLNPGQANDYHLHPSSEHLHIVMQGECEYALGDQPPVVVRAGDAVMVPAGVPHGIRNCGAEPASYVAITSPGPYEKVRVERPEAPTA